MIKAALSKYAMKGMAVIMLALLAALAAMYWQLTRLEGNNADLTEANGRLEQVRVQLIQNLSDQKNAIDDLKAQIQINDKVITENAEAKAGFASENNKLKLELRKLKSEKPEVRDYFNQHKPASIISMLQSLQGTGDGNKDGSGDGNASGKSHAANSEADASLFNQRMRRSAHNRLQHAAGLLQC